MIEAELSADQIEALSELEFDALIGAMGYAPLPAQRARWHGFGVHGGADDPEAFVRPTDAAALLGIGRTTLYKWVNQGRLPKPIRLSHRVAGWPRKTLLTWRDAQEGGPLAKRGKLAQR